MHDVVGIRGDRSAWFNNMLERFAWCGDESVFEGSFGNLISGQCSVCLVLVTGWTERFVV